MMERLPVLRSALLLLLIWAGIFLPTLGTLELRGEEGRRILPGAAMLETGDWIVPKVAGEDYLRKPPMINWLVAGSFALTGVQNEWTARMPSVLGVLLLAQLILLSSRRWLGLEGAFAAGVFAMANFGMIEKGRLIEIEALYAVSTGIAVSLWLRGWILDRPWWNWLGTGVALAFGFLLKGPVHLLFFYAVVIGVLWAARDWKKLFHPAHFAALLLSVGLVSLWWIPFQNQTKGEGIKMAGQIADRLNGSDFSWGGWLSNIPLGIVSLLPWAFFLPFFWLPLRSDAPEKIRFAFRGLRGGVFVSFILVSLAPGSLARYTFPITVPYVLLTTLLLTWGQIPERVWSIWRTLTGRGVGGLKILALRSGMIAVAAISIYSLVVIPKIKGRTVWRAAAEKINRAIPSGVTLYAVSAGSQSVFFYVRQPYQYVQRIREIPSEARYLLVQEKNLPEIRRTFPQCEELLRYPDRGGKISAVVRVDRPQAL